MFLTFDNCSMVYMQSKYHVYRCFDICIPTKSLFTGQQVVSEETRPVFQEELQMVGALRRAVRPPAGSRSDQPVLKHKFGSEEGRGGSVPGRFRCTRRSADPNQELPAGKDVASKKIPSISWAPE